MRWGLRSLLVLLWLIWPARGHALPAETWVVVIGNNRGDASDLQLLYAERDAREMAEANGWSRLVTNSAKLVNIIGGYGYRPTLLSMEKCIDSAVSGRIVQ